MVFVLSMGAELLSNDKPIVARYQGQWYVPMLNAYPETTFGGDFRTATDYLDPFIREQLAQPGKLGAVAAQRLPLRHDQLLRAEPESRGASRDQLFGTDDRGRDVLARLLYGFRISVLFGLALTALGVLIGVVAGAIQGYFGGRTDLALQRFIEVWSSVPELYLLLILASIFEPSIWILLGILAIFGWMGLSDYVRAEFLRNRTLEYVTAARCARARRRADHLAPRAAQLAHAGDRLPAVPDECRDRRAHQPGLPRAWACRPSTPSLGELLSQGKANLDAWWISLPTFGVLVGTLLLLIFIGEALRDALDTRKG